MTDDGHLVLVFDDGYVEDYHDVRPVLEARGVPAVFAITPDRLGREGYMTVDQVRSLAEPGCEIAVHGRRHRFLQAHALDRDADAGDERIVLDSEHVFPGEDGGIYPGDDFELVDHDGSEAVTVSGKRAGDDDPCVRLAGPLSRGFGADESRLRPAETTVRDEVLGGREALRSLGFDPTTFVFPYDHTDVRAWSLVRDEYDAVANTLGRSLPNPPGTARTEFRRWYLETSHFTRAELGGYLDAVRAEGGVGVLGGHSAWDTVTTERVERTIEMATERDIEVTTFRGLPPA